MMKKVFWIALLMAGTIGVGIGQQTKTVEIPGDAYTAYDIPEGGSALQLNINRANNNLVIDDSEIQLQDSSDTVQWYRSSATPVSHVYNIGTVLSAREYLNVFGHYHYTNGTGSGPLPTFNAKVAAPDVDIDPLTEEQEESLGVWIAKAGARKPVTVRAVQCRGPNNQQTLTWSSGKISLWTAASGGNPLSSGTTLAADQDQTRYAQGDNASGSIRDTEIKTAYTVSGDTAYDKVKLTVVGAAISSFSTVLVNATNDVSVTLSPNPPGITNTLQIVLLSGSGSAQFDPSGGTTLNISQSGTVKIKGLTASSVASNMMVKMMMGSDVLASNVFTVIEPSVEVTELSFANDYGIYNISDPVWKKQNNPNYPASYQKDNSLTMNVKLAITPSLQNPITISLKADGPGGLDALKTNISISGSETTVSGIITTGKLDNIVYSTTPSLTWSFSLDGTTWHSAGSSGPHKLYAIYGSPTCGDANFTTSNIDNAVGKATGESTESGIASKANDNVGANVYEGCICSDGFQKNFDAAMGNYPTSGDRGMCCCRAEGLDCVLNVLGIGPYTHDYVNEHDEPNSTMQVYMAHCDTCNKDVLRQYWDSFWNVWEGVVKAGGAGSTCYAPANGSISIDEGTYSQIDSAIAADCGYYWQWGPYFENTCPHLSAP